MQPVRLIVTLGIALALSACDPSIAVPLADAAAPAPMPVLYPAPAAGAAAGQVYEYSQ